ncbi:hypothetical protein PR048_014370 [Dryococelus australis]|uniref:DDE Tnp4 domain-containing protein n=1 Tax=Dryococelus australis TaxID=614101 RepID=A0ABQ9HE72_9NEOP|nr:hypothetical protein PR048_014370 [Dryococelus australis]
MVEINHTRLITACAMMHNICVTMGDILQPVPDLEEDCQEVNVELDEVNAGQFRDHLARNLQVPAEMQL